VCVAASAAVNATVPVVFVFVGDVGGEERYFFFSRLFLHVLKQGRVACGRR